MGGIRLGACASCSSVDSVVEEQELGDCLPVTEELKESAWALVRGLSLHRSSVG